MEVTNDDDGNLVVVDSVYFQTSFSTIFINNEKEVIIGFVFVFHKT